LVLAVVEHLVAHLPLVVIQFLHQLPRLAVEVVATTKTGIQQLVVAVAVVVFMTQELHIQILVWLVLLVKVMLAGRIYQT
jgi:hypothetical protein